MMTVDAGETEFSSEWKVKQSKSHPGYLYYYNIITGESTWKPPSKNKKAIKTPLKKNSKVTSRLNETKGIKITKASTMKQKPQIFRTVTTLKTIPNKGKSPLKRNGSLTKKNFHSSLKTNNKESLSELPTIEKSPMSLTLNLRCPLNPSTLVQLEEPLKINSSPSLQAQRVILKAKRLHSAVSASLPSPSEAAEHPLTKDQVEVVPEDSSFSDIEMLDLEDLSSLEVHHHQDNSPTSDKKAFHIVVDTNILLQELKFLNELKDLSLKDQGPPYIIIPWVVIQELDSLKNKNKKQPGDNTFKKAACAVHFLYNLITKDHPRIRGQTAAEAEESAGTLKAECNDDKILQCCLHLATKVPEENIILLTNDKNLCSKACINHIRVFTKESFVEHFKLYFNKKQNISCSKESPIPSKTVPEGTREIVEAILLDVLTPIFEQEMKDAYGNIWATMMNSKPPWSLQDIFQGIIKFWNAVFSFAFMKDSKNVIVEISQLLKKQNQDSREVLRLVELGHLFCCQLRFKYSSQPKIDDSLKQFSSLRINSQQGCTGVKRRSSSPRIEEDKKVRPALTEEENKKVLDQFQLVWDVINTVCGTTLDVLNFPHDFKYCRPAILPSQNEIIDFLAKFFPRLELLYRQMSKLVTNSSYPYSSLKGLCHSLTHLMPELGLGPPDSSTEIITPSLLEAFVTSPGNKELLWNGWVQLKQFYEVLHTCLRCKS